MGNPVQDAMLGMQQVISNIDARSAKRAEYKQREQAADRMTTEPMAKKLDKAAAMKVDNSLADYLQKGDEISLNTVGALTSAIRDEDTYKEAMRNLTPVQKEKFGISGKGFKKDKDILKYTSDRYIHTQKQIQALELESQKAASKGTQPKYKPPGKGGILTGDPLGAFQTQMMADPDFEGMGTDDFTKVSQRAAMLFSDFQQVNEAKNNQRAANNLPPIEFNQTKAFDKAKKQTKEYLYDGVDTEYWFGLGEPTLKYLSPKEAQERELKWKQSFIQMMAQKDPKFLVALQTDPYGTEDAMKAIYQKEQAMRMRQDEIKIHGSINSR